MGETLMEVSTDEKGGVQAQPQVMVRSTLVYHYRIHQPIVCVSAFDSDYSRFRVSSPVAHCSLQSLTFFMYRTVESHVNSNGS